MYFKTSSSTFVPVAALYFSVSNNSKSLSLSISASKTGVGFEKALFVYSM